MRAERALIIPAPTLEPDLGHASGGSEKRSQHFERPARHPGAGRFVLQSNMRTVIIANGEPPTPRDIERWLRPGDQLICADGGARAALALDLCPQHVIGDFDSLTEDDLRKLEARGAQLHRHSPRKDETDLELALLFAARGGATEDTESTEVEKIKDSMSSVSSVANEIIVLGAMGGRRDHELANMLLLAMPQLRHARVTLAHGDERIFLIDARDGECTATQHGQPGEVVSLLPFGGDAHGVRTQGLEYPLRDESLFVGPARGVSNVMLGQEAAVSLRAGMLLCVMTSQA
jgi:thiamine pyrophosphokinase